MIIMIDDEDNEYDVAGDVYEVDGYDVNYLDDDDDDYDVDDEIMMMLMMR